MSDNNNSNHSILLVEDDPFISELYNRALAKAGYQVEAVKDGKEAYELIKADKYDIILLDLMLPNLLGIDMLKQIRQELPSLKARIIVVTNLGQTADQRDEIEKLADGYLIKAELTPRQLVAFVNKVQ